METFQKDIEQGPTQETLAIQLSITTMQGERFIDAIEKLCKKYSVEKDYFLKFK